MSTAIRRPRSLGELRLLLRVLAVLILVRLLLPCVKLKRLVRWLGSSRTGRAVHPAPLQTVAWYTDALLQRMPSRRRGNCLPRSLTLFFFAARAGLPVRIHCGVRRVGQALEGHAWLTLGPDLFLEKGDPNESYRVIFSYPDPSPGETSAEALALRCGSGWSLHG
jgi:hypothetical protein